MALLRDQGCGTTGLPPCACHQTNLKVGTLPTEFCVERRAGTDSNILKHVKISAHPSSNFRVSQILMSDIRDVLGASPAVVRLLVNFDELDGFGLVTAIISFLASFVDFHLHSDLDHDDAVKLDVDNGELPFVFPCFGTRQTDAGLTSQRFTRRSCSIDAGSIGLDAAACQQVAILFDDGRVQINSANPNGSRQWFTFLSLKGVSKSVCTLQPSKAHPVGFRSFLRNGIYTAVGLHARGSSRLRLCRRAVEVDPDPGVGVHAEARGGKYSFHYLILRANGSRRSLLGGRRTLVYKDSLAEGSNYLMIDTYTRSCGGLEYGKRFVVGTEQANASNRALVYWNCRAPTIDDAVVDNRPAAAQRDLAEIAYPLSRVVLAPTLRGWAASGRGVEGNSDVGFMTTGPCPVQASFRVLV
ncbi:hypothetical protein EV421DRAFT_1916078 [Armillaria borealis]|uniref:Uncharacterized protein n=1 Tax=Armillaria borealis TaxID=47425 RepID=A0AA39IEM1_9AGAR|nr:hypothetical protein EV421DRAFT_1916078 [Armillaria borealis]